ncbi:DUF7283 family protein [Candidatus Halobonum tyrrellensis]|uniref:Uncharacterized protein n=1 Tax=Candidatus Halobonum tyrrellensis G22 TaxID=1324957 RepID=V4HAY1_9EURY|nr:hypothetical protein [Candidatus Halobonum tyrrellensis]ESP87840.1 hypothetical protein K933_12036 [Candidatus Halobonum tyrrellensis G22]
MFDAPVDAWYAWLGVAAAATVTLAVAAGLPTAPPPNASAPADLVDGVAAADAPADGEYRLAADAVRVRPDGLDLRDDAGAAHARFAFGPVVAVADGPLVRVARGRHPDAVFDSSDGFAAAVADARDSPPGWVAADRLVVRHVAWGGVDVALVAAV